MEWTKVATQAEMDAAIQSRKPYIELTAAITVDVRVPVGFIPVLKAIAGALLLLWERSHAVLRESSHAELWESSHAELWGSSHAELWGRSHAVLRESSHAELWGSSHAELWGRSHAVLRGRSHAVLRESSHAELWGSSHAELWGRSHAVLRGSSHAELWESSHAELWGSSHAVLRESSHANACGATSLSLFGGCIKAKATVNVAVQLHDNAQCDGGTQIVIRRPTKPAEWCEYYGAEIVDDNAILFKGLDAEWRSPKGATYKPGTETVAADWDGGDQECGGGLHFSPSAGMTLEFNSDATKFVACRVPLINLAIHADGAYPHKVKAERCWNWYECDRHGTQIGERFEQPTAASS